MAYCQEAGELIDKTMIVCYYKRKIAAAKLPTPRDQQTILLTKVNKYATLNVLR